MGDSIFGILFSSIFVSNIILSRFLGMCSFLGVSKNFNNSLGMGAAVTFVMLLATMLSYALYHLILVPFDLTYLKTLVFILSIATLVQLVEMFMKKTMPALHKAMGIYLPLITTNCAIWVSPLSTLNPTITSCSLLPTPSARPWVTPWPSCSSPASAKSSMRI